jgi:putative flippase GtrA
MAGLGKRFTEAGYAQVKPLIPVSGRAMVIQAARDLPDAPRMKFVLREDLPGAEAITQKLLTSFVGAEPEILEGVTEGQAITCQLGLRGLAMDEPVTFGACDNGMLYDPRKFEALLADGGPDVLVWVVRGHSDGRARPQMFGWVDADETGVVRDVRVKRAPEDPATAPMIVGAFTFRRARDFDACANALVARDGRVNGEFYVDSLIRDAVERGLDVRLFEIDHYVGWGTPNDLRTFEYWQSCFHKWPGHPYALEKDRRIPPSQITELRRRYAPSRPKRPQGIAAHATERQPRGALGVEQTAGEGLRFIPVGVAAVAIDYVVYISLVKLGLDHSLAKAVSFLSGALAAFLGNRYFTFARGAGVRGMLAFAALYVATLGLNVAVNAGVLALLPQTAWRVSAAFLAATGTSAISNFVGMKFAVFTRETPGAA